MGKTFEALERAEERRRLLFPSFFMGNNGFKRGNLVPLVPNETNALYEEKLNQVGQLVDEISQIVSGLISSIKKTL